MAGMSIGTPNTNNNTIKSDDFDMLASPEKSFAAPAQVDYLKGDRKYGANLKTPRTGGRDPLRLLPNLNHGKPAFTPLLKSVAKTNMAARISARRGVSHTPSLARMDDSNMHSEHTSSYLDRHDFTPMPNHLSSSVASTPIPQLSDGRGGAILNDGNIMTLREQEGVIDKIEKENFGLKMKIHFLEENLSKRGSEFNQAALKENTDLKVNRITMQKELHKFKKTIAQAEKDAENYRRQLEEYKERKRQRNADESVRIEITKLKSELDEKRTDYIALKTKFDSTQMKNDSEADRLRDELADLQADLRERDRQLEEREDEIDALKSKANKESNIVADREDELESAKQEIESLRDDLNKAEADVTRAKKDQINAEEEKHRAEADLDELKDEMANKSFTTKGLSRQLQDKAAKFEDDYHELQERFQELQKALTDKSNSERRMQDRLREIEKEGSTDLRRLQQDLEATIQQRDTLERKFYNMTQQMEAAHRELKIKTEEKDLLQSRHDALTSESAQLQDELNQAQKSTKTYEVQLEQERQKCMQIDGVLRQQHRGEIEQLTEQVDHLHKELSEHKDLHISDKDKWTAEKRDLEAAKERSEERSAGLQRTIDKLNDVRGTLSGKETKLQEALESEKQRHEQEEQVLQRQIQELNQDLLSKRASSETSRSELTNAREELRISLREQALLKEKVRELEDEIEVLQADIEQEHEMAQQVQQKSFQATDTQVAKIRREKSELQEALAMTKIELESARRNLEVAICERQELEARLAQAEQPKDDTSHTQHESRELRREKQKLERDLEKITLERDNLNQSNRDLEEELDAEIERATAEENKLNVELDQLRNKQNGVSDAKERELSSARSKVSRLETRVHDLEEQLEARTRRPSSPDIDVSGLRADLAEARKSETEATKRETTLKNANRELKMKMHDLERDLHEARLAELKARSPSSTSSSNIRGMSELRGEIFHTRAQIKSLQDENSKLKRSARNAPKDETHDVLVQAQLESLQDDLDARNKIVEVLRKDLDRLRLERDEARRQHMHKHDTNTTTRDLRDELDRLRSERNDARDMSIKLAGSSANRDAFALKHDLVRLREERSSAAKRTHSVEQELDVVQSRYEALLERLSSTDVANKDNDQEREVQGLMREVLWLKAKCRREQRLRQDLAWSKTWLENSEAMRVQCNQIDLRILREMGVDIDRKKYDKKLNARQKFRAGVWTVVATIRMERMHRQWQSARKIGDELKSTKDRGQKHKTSRAAS